MKVYRWIVSLIIVASVLAGGLALAAWKRGELRKAEMAAAGQPEPMEAITSLWRLEASWWRSMFPWKRRS